MAVELHVRSRTLATLVGRLLQRVQLTTCAPAFDGIHLDHVDPVPDECSWEPGPDALRLRLPVEVYLVTLDELLAHVDAVPPGARDPKARITLVMRVAVAQGALDFSVEDVDLGVAAALPAAEELRRAVLAAAPPPAPVSLVGVLAQLGIDTATSASEVRLVEDRVVARFGRLDGPPVPVAHDFDWGLSIDGDAVAGLVAGRVPPRIGPVSVRTTASWASFGSAFVDATVVGAAGVFPAELQLVLDLDCTLSMPAAGPELRLDIVYDVDIRTGVPILDPVLSAAVTELELGVRAAINPATFGGVRTAENGFAITLPLPEIRYGSEVWRYDGLVPGPAGLVLGGRVDLPVDLSGVLLRTTTRRFSGGGTAFLFCSRDQDPQTPALAHLFSSVAVVEYEGGGRLCGVDVLDAGDGFEDRLTLPAAPPLGAGVRPGQGTIAMAFGAVSGNQVQAPIRLVVRTSRGVRCCNLGRPEQFTILEDGTVEGGRTLYFDDCDRLPPHFDTMTPDEYDRWTGLIWYTYWGLEPGKDYDPDNPPILPDSLETIPADWTEVQTAARGLLVDTRLRSTVVVPEQFRIRTTGTDVAVGGIDPAAVDLGQALARAVVVAQDGDQP